MGKSLSTGKRPTNSPKETEKRPGDIDYKGRTPRVPKDSDQEFSVYTDPPITGHNNSIDSSKRNETITGSTQYHDVRPEDNILGNKDIVTHFNVNTKSAEYSKSFSSSESTNRSVQTTRRVTEHAIIEYIDIGGNSENYEQTDPNTTNEGKETKKKKNKKKKGILASLMTEPFQPMKAGTTEQGDSSVKDKMRTEPFEPMKAGTTEQGDSGVKDKMRPEPPELMKAETTPYLFKNQDETGVKDKIWSEPPEPMKAETTPYLLKQQDETGVKDEMSVTEQQLKTMTMEAERLTERCRYDIETSNANDKELKLCLKAFIQSISSVEKYISNLVLENSKLVMEKNEYLNRPMKAECLLTQEENTGGKNKMSVAEQQVKAMTMEAERLAERCVFHIEILKTDDKELRLCPKAFMQSISSVEKYIFNLRSKKDDYLNKLSSAAGARLTDNNPNITSLHDPNRPMKLAEKFNKIYDDEWTDMIEKLEKIGHNTEEHKDKCVYHLYSILIVIFNSLSKKSEVQLKGLAKHLFLLTKPSTEQIHATWDDYKEERVQLIVSRKKTAVTTILMLYQNLQTDPIFVQELRACSPPLEDVMLYDIVASEYFMKCVEICWYFVIQDPPMYVETVSLKGTKIDKDTHKVYTKSGDIVKYHVWPALYLHHQDGTNGPMMGKGVVQPK